MSWIDNVINSGIDKVSERYIRKKLIVSNVIGGLITVCLAIPFIVVSYIHFPELAYWPIWGTILAATAILIVNRVGLHILGRGMVSIVPILLTICYNAEMLDIDESIVLSTYLLMFSLLFVPCLVFDIKEETGWFIFFSGIGVLAFSNFEMVNGWFETSIDESVVRDGYLNYVYLVVALTVGFGNVIVLSLINMASEVKVEKYVEQANNKNESLVLSEKALNDKLSELGTAKKRDDENAWLAKGIADVGDILRENRTDLTGLSNVLVLYLVKYLKASNATFFVLDKDAKGEEFVEVKATYAYYRNKEEKNKTVVAGGLIDEAFKNGEFKYVTDNISERYLEIKSGLGNAVPKTILIVPFKDITENKVEGVLEMASFKDVTDIEIEFLNKLAENVASAIKNNKIAMYTKGLLNDAQQMSLELREQEEELRQNAEEMMATQEQLEKQLEDSAKEIQRLKEKYDEK